MPNGKTFGSWKSELSSIPQATQNALGTLEWVSRRENCVISGPSGTGKSHFIEALCHQAIDADLRVSWFTLETLAATFGRAHVDGSVAWTIAKICRSDIIVVDDIGLLPVGHETAEAFYRLVDAAYERRSLAVTSNIHPSGSRSCPRPWPQQPSTGSCATPTWSRPAAELLDELPSCRDGLRHVRPASDPRS
ncbi:ATP-binding protein [Nonomuraea wenchangensis]|uniref:ATP-binding protein n=1 Tax=Nonomuraea wenchangensis TaxID=568860 RepID=UPI00371E32AF